MKIVFFMHSLGAGGAERNVINLIDELCKTHDIWLILMSQAKDYNVNLNANICYIDDKTQTNNILKLIKLPIYAIKFKKIVTLIDCDIIISFLNRPSYIAAMSKMFGLDKKLIISERTTPSLMYAGNSIKSKINTFLIRYLYKRADLIISNSNGAKLDLVKNFSQDENKIIFIPNSLDIKNIQSLADQKFDYLNRYFLNIGRLDGGKNHKMSILAFANIKKHILEVIKDVDKNELLKILNLTSLPSTNEELISICQRYIQKFHLIILGDGELKESLQNLACQLNIANRVDFYGFCDNPFMFIKNAFCFVCSTNFEGFSNVLIEALALNKAIISTRHKNTAFELLDDNSAALCDINDDKQMSYLMCKMIFDAKFLSKFTKDYTYKVSMFDKKNVAIQFQKAIYKVCNEYNI